MYVTQLQNPDSFAHIRSPHAAGRRKRDVVDSAAVVQLLPGFATSRGAQLLDDFQAIMDGSRISMNIRNSAADWWSRRRQLDEQLKVRMTS